MKIYISIDIEGITGVVSPLQCNPAGGTQKYRDAVSMMAQELGWACHAIWEADESAEIVVNDAHCRMENLDVFQLPESADIRLISGKPKLIAMMHGLDKSFDAAMLIGYHAKAGTRSAVLAHTFHHHITDVSINGQSLGEAEVNSLYASLVCNVPVILAAGDTTFVDAYHRQNPDAAVIATKTGLGYAVAECYSATTVEESYYRTVEKLFDNTTSWKSMKPTIASPFTLDIAVADPLAADILETLPLFERLDGRGLRHVNSDFEQLYRALQSAYSMLSYADYQR